MSFKSFLIASLIIHTVGLTSLYFYYNPIILSPEPVEFFEKENLPAEQAKNLKENRPISKIKKSVLRRKQREKKQNILPEKQVLTAQSEQKNLKKKETQKDPADLDFHSEDLLISTQKEALSEAKDPLPEIQEPSIETADSPIEFHLEEIKEENALSSKPPQSPPQDLADSVEVKSEASPPSEQLRPAVKLVPSDSKPIMSDSEKKLKTPPQNLEDFKNIEEQENAKKTKEAGESVDLEATALETDTSLHEQTNAESASSSPAHSIQTFQSLKQKIGNPPLFYPDFARRAGMQGTVSVLFFVTRQGLVDKIQLKSSSGHLELDNFVIRTLARYEFLPGQESWVQYQIPFVLEGKEIERLQLRQEKQELKN